MILILNHDVAFAGVALHGLVGAAANNELGAVIEQTTIEYDGFERDAQA